MPEKRVILLKTQCLLLQITEIVSNYQDSKPEGQAKAVQATSKHFLGLKRLFMYKMSYFRFEIDFSIASAVSGTLWAYFGGFWSKTL